MEKEKIQRTVYQTTSSAKAEEYNKRHPKKRKMIRITDYSPAEYEELVFLEGADFKKLFGYEDGNPKLGKCFVPIVKVTNPESKKSVHLLFRTSWEIEEKDDYAVMTYSAIKRICSSKNEIEQLDKVELSKGCLIPYLFHHPIHTIRCSFFLGVLSMFLGVISLIISFWHCK